MLRALGTNCSLHESNFNLCSQVVLDWLIQFADQWHACLTKSGLRPMALFQILNHGWLGVRQSLGIRADWLACHYCSSGTYLELSVHSGSPVMLGGECGVV